MATTLLTGATGTLGSELLPRLVDAGHEVRAASRTPPAESSAGEDWVTLDLLDGGSVEDAVEGVDVVVHAATAPRGDTERVDVRGTERLVEAAEGAGVDHFLYVSIVGVDRIPYSYYQHKRSAERVVAGSDVPWTVVRATQFHSFVHEVLASLSRLPVLALPTEMRLQPIDEREAADAVVEHVATGPSGRVDPVGGPEVLSAGELARTYRSVRGLRRPVLRLPLPGAVIGGFRDGHALCPDHRVGAVTWEEWLEERHGCER